MTGSQLKLRAHDGEDLAVIAACLQDATTQKAEMAYDPAQNRFICVFRRYVRELLPEEVTPECEWQIVESAFIVDQVVDVRYRGLEASDAAESLVLITMGFEPIEENFAEVTLIFDEGAAIRIRVLDLHAKLHDFGEPECAEAPPRERFSDEPLCDF